MCSLRTDNIAMHRETLRLKVQSDWNRVQDRTARATTGYLKQCRYSIRLRFRSSSLIPAYRKRAKEEAAWNCQLRLWIYKGPGRPSPDRRGGDPILSIFWAWFVRVYVNRVAVLLAHRSSVEREPAAARFPWSCWRRTGLHLIGILGSSRWKECSILRAVVYDLDKLAFAGFRREKRVAGSSRLLIVTTRASLFQPRIFTSS